MKQNNQRGTVKGSAGKTDMTARQMRVLTRRHLLLMLREQEKELEQERAEKRDLLASNLNLKRIADLMGGVSYADQQQNTYTG